MDTMETSLLNKTSASDLIPVIEKIVISRIKAKIQPCSSPILYAISPNAVYPVSFSQSTQEVVKSITSTVSFLGWS